MNAAAGRDTLPETRPTPAALPAATDVATLQKKLDDTLKDLDKAHTDFAALQRKLDVEGPRAAADLRAAKDELKKAGERITTLEGELKKKIETLEITSLTAAERQSAGEDMVTVAGKVAREIVDARLAEVLPPMTKRIDLLAQLSEEGYQLQLERIPNFSNQNNDPKFIAWLNQNDPGTGRLRLDLILQAEHARQGFLVADIFAAFRENREIGAPLLARASPHIDPPEGGAGDPPAGGDATGAKTIWTRADIKRHYNEKVSGVWRGKEKEWREIELDINAAYREGRVKG